MNISSFFKGLIGKKSATDIASSHWMTVGGSADLINDRSLLLANREWVYIAVDRVATSVAAIPIQVKRYKKNGDDVEVFDGPLVKFLERPGQGITGKDFVYLNTVYKELTGNAFWEKRNRDGLAPLIPTSVRPNMNAGKLISYRYTAEGQERNIPIKDVLHDMYIDPNRPYWGAGKLQKIARWADTSSHLTEFLQMFFVNGASFGGFITTEEETEERIKMIKAGLANDHTGVSNAHKLGVLPKGSDYKQTTSKMSDMEMGATDDRYRDKILATFGVPKSVLGLVEDVNRANAEANEYVFAKYTLQPIIDDMMEFLNVYVMPGLDSSGHFYFTYEDFIPKNRELDVREREVALARQPYKTQNEVRAEEGLPPVSGGDVIYVAPFLAPLGSAQETPEDPRDDTPEDDPAPAPTKSTRKIPRHVLRKVKAEEQREGQLDETASKLAKLIGEHADTPDEIAWKDFKGRVDEFQKQLENKVREFNFRQKEEVINQLSAITQKDVNKSDIFDHTLEVGIMMDFVRPILRGLLTDQAIAEYEAQGFEGTWDNNDVMLPKIVDKAAKRLAVSYNNTTAKLLAKALNDGLQDGLDLNALTDKIAEVYDHSDTYRAAITAHTESVYIANKANVEAWKQSGVVRSQRWYTQSGDPCEYCRAMDGKVVDVDTLYFKKGDTVRGVNGGELPLDYRSIGEPPLHTNCYCILRPEDIEI